MQNMITGKVGSIDDGVKLSQDDRCPSWKIQTSAPNDALIDRKFMSTALSGRTTEPSSRNSTMYVATTTNDTAAGVFPRMKLIASTSYAVNPVTSSSAPAGGAIARMSLSS